MNEEILTPYELGRRDWLSIKDINPDAVVGEYLMLRESNFSDDDVSEYVKGWNYEKCGDCEK